ncbi:hypothetical protein Sa4125_39620 [Aureimonas sp. SA4125]|nr:hypothetical protein Sa4125_39620 [Aureimonas sp. SA4125]
MDIPTVLIRTEAETQRHGFRLKAGKTMRRVARSDKIATEAPSSLTTVIRHRPTLIGALPA